MFQVRTLDGRLVWRRRHYRVRRAKAPGTFHFSVLDNGAVCDSLRFARPAKKIAWIFDTTFCACRAGVISKEYWR